MIQQPSSRSRQVVKVGATRLWPGWLAVALTPVLVLIFAPADWPRWAVMVAIVLGEMAALKWLTWQTCNAAGLPWWRHVAYLLAWPGLDATAFLGARHADWPGRREWLGSLANIAGGATLCWGAARVIPVHDELILGWVGIVGIILIVHCGLFRLLSCGWRALGIDASPLMNRPLLARSVSDFWGNRWNIAYRDFAHRLVFRPLTVRLGWRWAAVAVFVFSGLIHELVISIPAGGGYGGPMLYFLVQALALFLERWRYGRRLGLGEGVRGWVFAMIAVVGPACALFHPPFVQTVVFPLMLATGMAE